MSIRPPAYDPEIGEQFSRVEAIAILCRVVARFANEVGCEGDAQACLRAEGILRRELRAVYCAECGHKIVERVQNNEGSET